MSSYDRKRAEVEAAKCKHVTMSRDRGLVPSLTG